MVKVIKQYVEIVGPIDSGDTILKKLEMVGRTCYRSEEKITPESSIGFIQKILKMRHLSIIEHYSISLRLVTNKAITHQLVRHRISSYAQESQRFVDYNKKGMTFILPVDYYMFETFIRTGVTTKAEPSSLFRWLNNIARSEDDYKAMREDGSSPQLARSVLSNSVKTEIVVTMNLRSWIHFLEERCGGGADPQIIDLAKQCLVLLNAHVPVIFDDLYDKYIEKQEV